MSAEAPYEELARLAERGAELAAAAREANEDAAARLAELNDVYARSAAIAAELPERPPESARPALERAAAAERRIRAHLAAALAATREELERADRGRRAARSYRATAAAMLDRHA